MSTGNDRLSVLNSCIEQLTELERIELPEPPIVEPSLAESLGLNSAKRRRRTRYTPLPGIMEHAVYLAPNA